MQPEELTEIDWKQACKRPGTISTARIVNTQKATQALNPQRILQQYMAVGKRNANGHPRESAVQLSNGYDAFEKHPDLPNLMQRVPKGTAGFDFTPGQKKVIVYLAFGSEMDLPLPSARLVYDSRLFGRSAVREGDQHLVEARVQALGHGCGAIILDTLTGSGKTVISLAAGLLRLGDSDSWEKLQAAHLCRRATVATYGANGVSFADDDSNVSVPPTLARAFVVTTCSPALKAQFEGQLSDLWPAMSAKLPGIKVDVWSSSFTSELQAIAHAPGSHLTLRTSRRSISALTSQPASTITIWLMGTTAKDNAELVDSRKRSMAEFLECGSRQTTIPLGISDELMTASSKILPGQGAIVLQHWIVQATPSSLPDGTYAKNHWIQSVLSPHLRGLIQGRRMAAPDMYRSVQALGRLSIMSLPVQLRDEVASDVYAMLPSGLSVWPIPLRSGLVLPRLDRDALTQVPLMTFLGELISPAMQREWKRRGGALEESWMASVDKDGVSIESMLKVCTAVAGACTGALCIVPLATREATATLATMATECLETYADMKLLVGLETVLSPLMTSSIAELRLTAKATRVEELLRILIREWSADEHPARWNDAIRWAMRCQELPRRLTRLQAAETDQLLPEGSNLSAEVVMALRKLKQAQKLDLERSLSGETYVDVNGHMCHALEALISTCSMAILVVSFSDRLEITHKLAALDRCIRLLKDRDACLVCFGHTELSLMPCCVAPVCMSCANQIRRTQNKCPNCRGSMGEGRIVDMSILAPTPAAVSAHAEVISDAHGDDRMVSLMTRARSLRRGGIATLKEVMQALPSRQTFRVLLYCQRVVDTDLQATLNDVLSSGSRNPQALPLVSTLTGRTTDRQIIQAYRDTAAHPEPMLLLCRNSTTSSEVIGLDLGMTTAIIVVGALCNPSQLIARVLRPGPPGQSQRLIPLVILV